MPDADPADVFPLLVADIYEAAGLLRSNGERIATAGGQSQARWQLMSVVAEGEWTVPATAERLGVTRQAVQRIANELVAEGVARFEANPRHRRSPFLRLTAHGRETLAAITARARDDRRRLFAGLVSLDLARFRVDVRQLIHALRVTS